MTNAQMKTKLVGLVNREGIASTNVATEVNDVTVLIQSRMNKEALETELAKAERIVAAKKEAKEVATAAVSETLTASKQKEEKVMTNNDKMLDKWAAKTAHVEVKTGQSNSVYKPMAMEENIDAAIAKFLQDNRPELPIVVESTEWSLKEDGEGNVEFSPFGYNKNRYGWLTIRVAPGVLQYHVYDSSARKFEWVDFADYNLNAAEKIDIFHPIEGSGLLVLPIYHSDVMGGFFVMLPNVKGMNEGEFRAIFKTRSNQFDSFSTNNNRNFNAVVTAHLRITQKQFIQDNPANRHAFNADCTTCQHSTLFGYKDQVDGDLEDKRSTKILEQPTVDILRALGGSEVPRLYCGVYSRLVDKQAVLIANAQEELDPEAMVGYDEEGNSRLEWTPKGKIKMGGELINRQDLRKAGTKGVCEHCPFYLKSEAKSNAKFNADVVAAREEIGDNKAELGKDIFVSKYFNEWARPSRSVIESHVDGSWVVGSPGEFNSVADFRTKGVGGLTIYNSEAQKEANAEFGVNSCMIDIEEYNEELAMFELRVQTIFNAGRNIRTISKEKAEEAFDYALNKPEGLDEKQSSRWDKAVQYLRRSLVWARDNEKLLSTPFVTKFSTEEGGEIRIHAHDLITELRFRYEEGGGDVSLGLGYEDLTPEEFLRHLDDTASLELMYEVLETGKSITVFVGEEEDELDAYLVAGAMQEMLQRQLMSFVARIRQATDVKEALGKMLLSKETKAYIADRL